MRQWTEGKTNKPIDWLGNSLTDSISRGRGRGRERKMECLFDIAFNYTISVFHSLHNVNKLFSSWFSAFISSLVPVPPQEYRPETDGNPSEHCSHLIWTQSVFTFPLQPGRPTFLQFSRVEDMLNSVVGELHKTPNNDGRSNKVERSLFLIHKLN